MEFIKITNSVWLKADNCSVEPTWPKHTLFFLVWKITLHICKLCLQFSHETYCKTSFLFVWYIHNDPKLHFVTISFGSLTLLKISFLWCLMESFLIMGLWLLFQRWLQFCTTVMNQRRILRNRRFFVNASCHWLLK